MEWEVSVKLNSHEKTYTISAERDYGARSIAVGKFLEEFKIPGIAVEYVSGKKKGLMEIVVRAAVDRRRISKYGPSEEFYSEQISKFRRWVRESNFSEDTKTEATRLLLQLGEVLSG